MKVLITILPVEQPIVLHKKTPFLDGALERSFQMLLVRQERVAQ